MTTVDERQEIDIERLYRLCKALASPVRIEIVRFVSQHPRCIANEILLHLPRRDRARSVDPLAAPQDPVRRRRARGRAGRCGDLLPAAPGAARVAA